MGITLNLLFLVRLPFLQGIFGLPKSKEGTGCCWGHPSAGSTRSHLVGKDHSSVKHVVHWPMVDLPEQRSWPSSLQEHPGNAGGDTVCTSLRAKRSRVANSDIDHWTKKLNKGTEVVNSKTKSNVWKNSLDRWTVTFSKKNTVTIVTWNQDQSCSPRALSTLSSGSPAEPTGWQSFSRHQR